MKPVSHLLASSVPFLLLAHPGSGQQVGGGWLEEGVLTNTRNYTDFGTDVDRIGDVDRDGVADILAGAPREQDSPDFGGGGVFLVSGRTGKTLLEVYGTEKYEHLGNAVAGLGVTSAGPRVAASYLAVNSTNERGVRLLFGGATIDVERADRGFASTRDRLAGIGDFNGDGIGDFVVGAPFETVQGLSASGSAYLFSGADGAELLRLTEPGKGAQFGESVAAAGDVDGDGTPDFAIGASGAVHGGATTGSVFVYSGATGARLLRIDSPPDADTFGGTVAGGGDVDADGTPDLLIAAPADGFESRGMVLVHSGATGAELARVEAEGEERRFGSALAFLGDTDQDGRADYAVGAPWTDASGAQFVGGMGIHTAAGHRRVSTIAGHRADDRFASTLAAIGDTDGDGMSELAVGSPGFDGPDGTDQGAVFVYGRAAFLTAQTDEVSVSAGGRVQFALQFPERGTALLDYQLLASRSGTGPFEYGVPIPLTLDPVVRATAQNDWGPAAGYLTSGTLDASAYAVADVVLAPGAATGLVGTTIHFAAVAFETGGLPQVSSVAVPVTLVP